MPHYKEDDPNKNDESRVVVVPPVSSTRRDNEEDPDDPPSSTVNDPNQTSFSNSYQINVILLLVSCWYAMTLTDWGRIPGTDTVLPSASNPNVGRVSMWIIIASQWIMFLLYVWSLLAPKIFPDRDFS
jgi:hypothetical protein